MSHEVVGPHGATAYDVSCFGGRWACAHEASRVCNDRPYVVLDENTALGMLTESQNGALRIQCTDVHVAAARAPAGESSLQQSEVACRRISLDTPRVAANWAVFRGSSLPTALPTNDAFARVCIALPGAARQCLNPRYQISHEDACARTLNSLDEAVKVSLDGIFLVGSGSGGSASATNSGAATIE